MGNDQSLKEIVDKSFREKQFWIDGIHSNGQAFDYRLEVLDGEYPQDFDESLA
ncbi:hypothetical protein HYU13_00880 [Candidatus Woesearchaeota archaeon]|nr:hypothetical protein [Candidatus Woesearchaeota archaeon]